MIFSILPTNLYIISILHCINRTDNQVHPFIRSKERFFFLLPIFLYIYIYQRIMFLYRVFIFFWFILLLSGEVWVGKWDVFQCMIIFFFLICFEKNDGIKARIFDFYFFFFVEFKTRWIEYKFLYWSWKAGKSQTMFWGKKLKTKLSGKGLLVIGSMFIVINAFRLIIYIQRNCFGFGFCFI